MARPLRVLLVVDQNADIVAPLLSELQRGDYEVTCERVDTPALMRIALERPSWDVILCDYNLEHFSASAALALLKDTGFDIPFLVLSAAEQPQEMRAALSLGAHDLIRYQNLARLVPAIEREVNATRVRAARALTEAALREAEANYQKLVEQIPVGIHVMALDADSSTLSISPQLERMLGFSQAEWVADPQFWVRQIHPADQMQVLAELAHVYTPGAKPFIAEYRMLGRDGQMVWIHDETILVRDAAGQPKYLQSVKLDITERKRLEAEAQAIEQRLSDWVKELEQTHRENSLLSEMSSQLQSCLTLEETYPVVADFAQLLFPAESGALYLARASAPEQMEMVIHWGKLPPEEAEFVRDDCLALRRGRLHVAEALFSGPVCAHVPDSTALSTLCGPLLAQGEMLGVLHLRLRRNTGPLHAGDMPRQKLSEAKQRLATTVAERLALALVTLKRQADLRARTESAGGTAPLANGNEPETGEDATPATPEVSQLVVGPLVLNCNTYELAAGERVVLPTPVEFELLQFLMRNAGRVFTPEQLLQEVWKYPPGTGSQEVVRAHVRNLRAKIEPNPRKPIYLRTVGRFGYTISAEEPAVEPQSPTPEA